MLPDTQVRSKANLCLKIVTVLGEERQVSRPEGTAVLACLPGAACASAARCLVVVSISHLRFIAAEYLYRAPPAIMSVVTSDLLVSSNSLRFLM